MKLLLNPKNIDWLNSQSYYFFNPKHPQAQEFKALAKEIPILESHLYLFSSSFSKICILSKKAFLYSAGLANKNLKAGPQDKWLIPLPLFHVSGLAILARCFLSKSSYKILDSWDPETFVQSLQKEKITLSSLVPSQVYDLLQKDLLAPKSLKAVLVGGDFLSPDLYKEARKRHWPLLPCYGATETASHIACAPLSSLKSQAFPKILLLKGIEAKLCPDLDKSSKKTLKSKAFYGFKSPASKKQKINGNKIGLFSPVKIQSRGLLRAYFDLKTKRFYDPKDQDQAFTLPDPIFLKNREILVKRSQVVKILGESFDLKAREELLGKLAQKQALKAYLLLVPDKRQAYRVILLSEPAPWEDLLALRANFNQKVAGYEKIQSIYILPNILKSRAFIKFKASFFVKELGF